MHLSTHYYVLSLSSQTNTLFEAFRDSLITIENQGFPVVASSLESGLAGDDRIRALARAVDTCFAQYFAVDPLGLMLVGDEEMQSAFLSVTVHGAAVIGRVEGDHTATLVRDLGRIVWPVVKEAMSGALDRAMRDLEELSGRGRIASGLEAVARVVHRSSRATLLVEDDYHRRGSVGGSRELPVISSNVDVRESIDDAVDTVVEMVLQSDGNVLFAPANSLRDHNRIVLLMHGTEDV